MPEHLSLSDALTIVGVKHGFSVGKEMLYCPFHHDTKPSLSVDYDQGAWFCFSCGMGGGALTLLRQSGMIERTTVRPELNQKQQVQIQSYLNGAWEMAYRQYEVEPATSKDVSTWAPDSPSTRKLLNILVCEEEHCLTFPVYTSSGALIGRCNKLLSGGSWVHDFYEPGGRSSLLYGAHMVHKHTEGVCLVEGVGDAIALTYMTNGRLVGVACLGTPAKLQVRHAAFLANKCGATLHFGFDRDRAGIQYVKSALMWVPYGVPVSVLMPLHPDSKDFRDELFHLEGNAVECSVGDFYEAVYGSRTTIGQGMSEEARIDVHEVAAYAIAFQHEYSPLSSEANLALEGYEAFYWGDKLSLHDVTYLSFALTKIVQYTSSINCLPDVQALQKAIQTIRGAHGT